MGGVAGVCLQVSCFVSCSLTAALLAVCFPMGSGVVCSYLESCQLCRLQRPKVNIIGAITKLISFSVAAVGGASLAAPLIQGGIGAHGLPLYIGTPASLSAIVPRLASLPQRRLSAVATPRRPSQQQLPDGSSPQRHSRQQLRHGVPASNKPHLAERSTPVWLAIWRIWAGFANSQLRRATFRSTYLYMCLSTLLPHRAAAQT